MRFVQIAVSSHTYADGTMSARETTLYALADDGTVWYTTGDTPALSEYLPKPWAAMRMPWHEPEKANVTTLKAEA